MLTTTPEASFPSAMSQTLQRIPSILKSETWDTTAVNDPSASVTFPFLFHQPACTPNTRANAAWKCSPLDAVSAWSFTQWNRHWIPGRMVPDPQVSRCVQRPINYAINYLLITSISSLACFVSRPAAGGRALGFLPPGTGMYVCTSWLAFRWCSASTTWHASFSSAEKNFKSAYLPARMPAQTRRLLAAARVPNGTRVCRRIERRKDAGKIRACVPLRAELPYCTPPPYAPSPCHLPDHVYVDGERHLRSPRTSVWLDAALCATFELFHTSNYVFAGRTFVRCTVHRESLPGRRLLAAGWEEDRFFHVT